MWFGLLLGLLWANSIMVCCCISLFLFFSFFFSFSSLLAVAVSVFRFLLLLLALLPLFLSFFLLRISGASAVIAFWFLALPLVPLLGFLFPGFTWSVCCVLVVPPRPAPPAAAAPPVGGGWVCLSLGLSWLSFSVCLLSLVVRVCVASALRLCGVLVAFVCVFVVNLSCGLPSSLSELSSSFVARVRAFTGFVFVVLWSALSFLSVSASSSAARFRDVARSLALLTLVTSSSSSSDVLVTFWTLSLSCGTTVLEKNS